VRVQLDTGLKAEGHVVLELRGRAAERALEALEVGDLLGQPTGTVGEGL